MQICDFGKAAIIERAIIRILQVRKNYVFGSVIAMTSTQNFQLQNSPYFCVFKWARAVKQKVWNEAENGE